MCGIFCSVCVKSQSECQNPQDISKTEAEMMSIVLQENLLGLLRKRGPDAEFDVSVTSTRSSIKLASYILWTQGSSLHKQPMTTEDNSKLFAFNGDIYSFMCSPIGPNINDGSHLFDLIVNCRTDNEMLTLLSNLKGPFAFILVDSTNNRIWFGRDFFGRSSLLFNIDNLSNSFFICSAAPVSDLENVCEIPSAGIFCLELEPSLVLKLYPWSCHNYRSHIHENTQHFINFLKVKLNFEVEVIGSVKPCVCTTLKQFPNILETNKSLQALEQLSQLNLSDDAKLLKVKEILKPYIANFVECLRNAVKIRVELKPPFCKNCILLQREAEDTNNSPCQHSKISLLFSGGLDSTVLAYLIAECLPPGESLDLINVAFSTDQKPNFNVPDRITGLQSFKALRSIFIPRDVKLNFVEVNITKSEVQLVRQKCILDLVSPLQSVLDDSIGCCLWFAARGQGIIRDQEIKSQTEFSEYTSPARIIFVGSGADELLGGYSRHRGAFEAKGWAGLRDEMQEDIDRISVRNLGRDNRIITNHGVCPRMPFLDENVVQYIAQECDLWVKCCPLFRRGLGEKILLRATAVELMGEINSNLAMFPKRAMQFGSRIAKLENSKEKGGDICRRLQAHCSLET